MVYEFKRGARIPAGADAASVAARLEDIRSRHGKLTAGTVADEAEADPENEILAPWFTWDEEVGMRKLHELEAGNLIRAVAVVKMEPDQQTPLRAYVITHENGDSIYEPIGYVLRQPDRRNALLAQYEKAKADADATLAELIQLIRLL